MNHTPTPWSDIERRIADAVRIERERCAACVPNYWLDNILTGSSALIPGKGIIQPSDIEILLTEIRARILRSH